MLSIIMPAYNEVEIVGQSIHDCLDVLNTLDLAHELIVVDDGSKDGTYDKARFSPNTVQVVGYRINQGKGHALKYAYQFTHGDLVMFLDADADLPPSQIPVFLDYMRRSNADVVVGSKRHPKSMIHYPLSRRFLSNGYHLLLVVLFKLRVSDTQVGIKLFRREVLDHVLSRVRVDRYAFDVELLVNAKNAGYKIIEAPVRLNYRYSSKVNLKAIWQMFWDTVGVFRRNY